MVSRPPTVSVVMPAYNAGRFIDRAIRSIRQQTLTDWELIVVNDGSSDDTGEVAERHAADDSRIRVIHQVNGGQAVANNRAIPEARAQYIARMDADDVSLPERLSALRDFLDANPSVVVAGTNAIVCDPTGKERHRTRLPESNESIREMLLTRRTNTFYNPTLMFRKAAWLACGGERPCFRHAHDLDLSLRLIAHGTARNLPIAGVQYRIHEAQDSSVATDSQAVCALAAFICSDARSQGLPEPEFVKQSGSINRQALVRAGVPSHVIDDAIMHSGIDRVAMADAFGMESQARVLRNSLWEKANASKSDSFRRSVGAWLAWYDFGRACKAGSVGRAAVALVRGGAYVVTDRRLASLLFARLKAKVSDCS